MRGIILAGGTGSRLGYLTRAVNKHLLPIGDMPMIYWALNVLNYNDVRDVTIVSAARGVGQLADYFGGGITFRVQDKPGGIAQAIMCAGRGDGEVAVILGDNVFLAPPKLPCCPSGEAWVFLKELPPGQNKALGVPTLDAGKVARVIEKPTYPVNDFAVTGLYVFNADVWDKLDIVRFSVRGEMEVADLLNLYAERGKLNHEVFDEFWGDAGTIEGMADCTVAVNDWKKGRT